MRHVPVVVVSVLVGLVSGVLGQEYTPGPGPLQVRDSGEFLLHEESRGKDLPVRVRAPEPTEDAPGPFPLVVFSHGMGGSSKPDLKAEFNAEPHVRGTCSMARTSAPNSANSQFFICFDRHTFLDKQYTVWGQVTEGMDAVDKLARGEPPRKPDQIKSLKVQADIEG